MLPVRWCNHSLLTNIKTQQMFHFSFPTSLHLLQLLSLSLHDLHANAPCALPSLIPPYSTFSCTFSAALSSSTIFFHAIRDYFTVYLPHSVFPFFWNFTLFFVLLLFFVFLLLYSAFVTCRSDSFMTNLSIIVFLYYTAVWSLVSTLIIHVTRHLGFSSLALGWLLVSFIISHHFISRVHVCMSVCVCLYVCMCVCGSMCGSTFHILPYLIRPIFRFFYGFSRVTD